MSKQVGSPDIMIQYPGVAAKAVNGCMPPAKYESKNIPNILLGAKKEVKKLSSSENPFSKLFPKIYKNDEVIEIKREPICANKNVSIINNADKNKNLINDIIIMNDELSMEYDINVPPQPLTKIKYDVNQGVNKSPVINRSLGVSTKCDDKRHENLNKNRKETFNSIINITSLEKVFSLYNVNSDGNCLFRALLVASNLNANFHNHLRETICNSLIAGIIDRAMIDTHILTEGRGISYLNYMNTMKKDGTWGTNLEIAAFAKTFNVDVTIFRLNTCNGAIDSHLTIGEEQNAHIYLVLSRNAGHNNYEGTNHYMALIPKDRSLYDKEEKLLISKQIFQEEVIKPKINSPAAEENLPEVKNEIDIENLGNTIDNPDPIKISFQNNIKNVNVEKPNILQPDRLDYKKLYYNADTFRRCESIVKVIGDGNCLFRAILTSIGKDEEDHLKLRMAISKWMRENPKNLTDKFFGNENKYVNRADQIEEIGTWGDRYEIHAFEQMSKIKTIIYQKSPDDKNYVCILGLESPDKMDTPKIALLYENQDCNKNHFDSIRRETSDIKAQIDEFITNYLDIIPSGDLNTVKWPKRIVRPGKNKVPPENYLRKTEYRRWTAYELEPINGLKVFSYIRIGSWVNSFYTILNKNNDLPDDLKVNYVNFTNKNISLPSFEEEWSTSWKDKKLAQLGLDTVVNTMKKNIHFSKNLQVSALANRYKVDLKLKKAIKNVICYTCSGRSKCGLMLLKYHGHLQGLVEHCKIHDSTIPGFSFINLELSSSKWQLIVATLKPLTYYLAENERVGIELEKDQSESENNSSKGNVSLPEDIIPGGYCDEEKYNCPNEVINGEEADIDSFNESSEEEESEDCNNNSLKDSLNEITESMLSDNRSRQDKRPDNKSTEHFNIIGWNARSAFKPENVYYIEKLLTESPPDFLLINESGEFKNKITKVVQTYNSLHSGNRVLTYFRKDISATPIWQDTWDSFLMIMKITLNKKSMILINAYRQPSNEEHTKRLIAILCLLDDRYKTTPIILFGDLNYRREELSMTFPTLLDRNFKFIYDTNPLQYTRIQQTKKGTCKSYLDYFIVKGISDYEFNIREPIGNSDHRSLQIKITQQEMRIKRSDIRGFKFSWAKRDQEQIGIEMLKVFSGNNRIHEYIQMVKDLRLKYSEKKIKLKSHFQVIEKIVTGMDWEQIRKIARNASDEGFMEFMICFEKLRKNRNDKEYFLRLRFYSDLNKNVCIVSNLKIKDKEFGDIVTTDREIMDKEISGKYKKLFKDINGKILLPVLSNKSLIYTSDMIIQALKKLNLKKATSWDFIPGMAFEIFKTNKYENAKYLADFINLILQENKLPDEMTLGRLLCLNKNASEAATIDGIRPIVILGVLIKIIECPILEELKKVKLNVAQLGFLQRMSTEVNILRLRQRLQSLQYEKYDRKKKLPKRYILFVDLKTAFDSVNLEKLIVKLKNKGVRIEVINTLIKLMNSSKISIGLNTVISINSGVAQGKLTSPTLFNIYIDDMLDATEKVCYSTMAFADDTVFICRDLEELYCLIKVIRKWSSENEIEINEKKSGILIVNDDGTDPNFIEKFPVLSEYKYLGVILNNKLDPRYNISAVNNKLKDYFKRNRMLHKKYFTPMSLIRITNYFVKSRISYGLSCFLDCKSALARLENTMITHIKSIFGVPTNTSHKRLMVILGEPEIKYSLSIRLLKNWYKYKEHFGEYPLKFKKTLLEYFKEEELNSVDMKSQDYEKHKIRLVDENLKNRAGEFLECELRNDHKEFLKKYIFCYPDLRDFYLIRFFTNTTKTTNARLFPICDDCGMENSSRHGANECPNRLKDREKIIQEIASIFRRNGLEEKNNLYNYLEAIFFNISLKMKKTDIRILIEKLKKIVMMLVRDDYKLD